MATNVEVKSASTDGETSADKNVEIWKIKKLIKSLEAARG
jgi:peptide chain release factor subunit 1